MNSKQIEAFSFYKKENPGALILFRIGESLVALSDDAERVAQSSADAKLVEPGVAEIPSPSAETLSALGDLFGAVVTVSFRNANGELDYPDVKAIEEDRKNDS